MTDVFLYVGEANPSDVILRDPTTTSSKVDYVLTCAAGAYAYAGQAATLTVARSLSLAAGAYAYTGQAATLTVARNLSLATGAYGYAGNAATLTYTPGVAKVDYTLACAPGEYALTGLDAVLTYEQGAVRVGGVSRRWIKRRKFWANQEVYKSVVAAYREVFSKEIAPDVAEQVTAEVVQQVKADAYNLPDRDIEAEIAWIEVQAKIMQAVMQLEDEEDEETAIFAML